ncbi:HD family phosphohydrolase [Pseudonocardiaceae bacterium YIM PH 21723]|nr:HD family phosphohydrolase [Pseudonocardiaceae bacterium YIM PH 21723]
MVDLVREMVRKLCTEHAARLPFHGWKHITFVETKAADFAGYAKADESLVRLAALVHDLNYLSKGSGAAAGRPLRRQVLADCGVPDDVAELIEEIVLQAETQHRGTELCAEAKALSDADTLFKVLPTTPIMFAHRFMQENEIGLRKLAGRITGDQLPLHEAGITFYLPEVRDRYEEWAVTNLRLWSAVLPALDDPDVAALMIDEL